MGGDGALHLTQPAALYCLPTARQTARKVWKERRRVNQAWSGPMDRCFSRCGKPAHRAWNCSS